VLAIVYALGNDLYYASCMFAGLKKMCQELPECCPTVAEHMVPALHRLLIEVSCWCSLELVPSMNVMSNTFLQQCRKDFRGAGCDEVCSTGEKQDGEPDRSAADMLDADSDDSDDDETEESSEESSDGSSSLSRMSSVLSAIPPAPELPLSSMLP